MLHLPIETEQLAQLVALKSGKTPEDVIREAVERHAVTTGLRPTRERRPIDMGKVNAIIERAAARRVLDPRPVSILFDEINEVP